MTDQVYYRDSYLRSLETDVTASENDCERSYVVLAETIFYPEGGGQPPDRGTISGIEVLDVQKVDGEIRHFVKKPLEPGPARVELDWQHRYDHMQQHTAQHLLTAVALRDFGWATTAFHLGPETSDIELAVPHLGRDDLDLLEEACSSEVRAAHRIRYRSADVAEFDSLGVRSRRLPEGFEGPVRLVEIEGLDLNTCGGTHLSWTAEIGTLCLLGTETMRGGTRLFFVAGERVRRRMAAHEARNLELRSLLDTGDDGLAGVVSLRLEKEKELARSVRRLSEELAESAAAELATRPESTVEHHWQDRDMVFLQTVARALAAAAPTQCALLTATFGGEALFVVVAGQASSIDLGAAGPRIADVLGGRGGGRPPVYQGKAPNLDRRGEALEILRDSTA